MILGYITVKNKKQAKEITKLLLEQNLLFTANISTTKVFRKSRATGLIKKHKQTVIEGKTKSLLFVAINTLLRKNYSKNMPMLYAVPIVYMYEEQSKLLRDQTAKL